NSVIGRSAAQFPLGGRKGASWGVAFVILLLVSAAMVSLPTAAERGDRITAFYKAHQQVIVWQQIIGTLALLLFLAFAAALSRWARMDGRRNRWLMPAAGLVVLATVATSLVAGAMALMPDLSPALAHQLTVIEDLADSVLFASLAGFVLATSTGAPGDGGAARAPLSWHWVKRDPSRSETVRRNDVRSIVFRAVIGTLGLLGLLGSTSLPVVAAPVNSPDYAAIDSYVSNSLAGT